MITKEILQEYREFLTCDREQDYSDDILDEETLMLYPWIDKNSSYPLIIDESAFLFLDQHNRLVGYYYLWDEMILIGENIGEGISNYKIKNIEKWPLLTHNTGEKTQTYFGRPSLDQISKMKFPNTTKEQEQEWKKMIDTLKETYDTCPLIGRGGPTIWDILLGIELKKGKVIEFSDAYTETLQQNNLKGKTPHQVVLELYSLTLNED